LSSTVGRPENWGSISGGAKQPMCTLTNWYSELCLGCIETGGMKQTTRFSSMPKARCFIKHKDNFTFQIRAKYFRVIKTNTVRFAEQETILRSSRRRQDNIKIGIMDNLRE
jgi:hypothetical protein